MSRVGRILVAVPTGATVTIAEGSKVAVKGLEGTLKREFPVRVTIEQRDDQIIVSKPDDLKKTGSLHGLAKTLISNMIHDVAEGYEKAFEMNGVSYRAAKQDEKLTLNLGHSRPVEMRDPEGIEAVMEGRSKAIVRGINREGIGQYAAEIRDKRRPEPYKGKSIKYVDKVIRHKVGKTGRR